MVSDDHLEWDNFGNEKKLLKREVKEGKITKADGDAITKFIKDYDIGENKITTVRTHHANLRTAARRSDIPLVECTVDDLNNLLSVMRSGSHPDVKEGGIGVSNYQKVFRVFYRYHSYIGVDPEAIEIDKEQGRQLQPDDLLFKEDVDALLNNCYELRDRALIALGLATGQRIDALRTLRIGDVKFRGQTMDIKLNEEGGMLKGAAGKKPLLWSKHYVKMWYEMHPYDDDPDAALFCPMPDAPLPDDRNPRGPLHYQTILDKIKRIAKRAHIEPRKRVYPHLLRHSAITRMVLEGLNEQKIKQVAGWAADSSQFETYVTLSDELTNDSIREQLGLPTAGDNPVVGRPTLQKCPECGDQLPEDPDHCPKCNVPLTTLNAVEGDYETGEMNPKAMVDDMTQEEMLQVVQEIQQTLSDE